MLSKARQRQQQGGHLQKGLEGKNDYSHAQMQDIASTGKLKRAQLNCETIL
jgi:hypothetical protein